MQISSSSDTNIAKVQPSFFETVFTMVQSHFSSNKIFGICYFFATTVVKAMWLESGFDKERKTKSKKIK